MRMTIDTYNIYGGHNMKWKRKEVFIHLNNTEKENCNESTSVITRFAARMFQLALSANLPLK